MIDAAPIGNGQSFFRFPDTPGFPGDPDRDREGIIQLCMWSQDKVG